MHGGQGPETADAGRATERHGQVQEYFFQEEGLIDRFETFARERCHILDPDTEEHRHESVAASTAPAPSGERSTHAAAGTISTPLLPRGGRYMEAYEDFQRMFEEAITGARFADPSRGRGPGPGRAVTARIGRHH